MLNGFKIGLNETQLGIALPEVAVEATKNILSPRQTEMALTMGTLFSTEEAFKIGFVDEVANDKTEGLEKCLNFLRKFENIPENARSLTKLSIRKKVLDIFERDRKKDIEDFVAFVQNPSTQKLLTTIVKK